MSQRQPNEHGYLAFYREKQAEIYAANLAEAKQRAVAHFKPKPKDLYQVSVHLCELADDTPVVHVADF